MAKGQRKQARKSLTENQKKEVIKLVHGAGETKYVVSDTIGQKVNDPVGTQINLPLSLNNPVPFLKQGVQNHQRVGTKVTNVRGRTHFSFSLAHEVVSSANWGVKIFMLTSKQAKSYNVLTAITTAPASNFTTGTLLDVGNQTTTDWVSATYNVVQMSMMPLSHEDWRGKTKTIKLSKNSGAMNNDASTPPPSPNSGHFATNYQFTWNWKHKTLLYDDATAGADLPTNFAPAYVLVAFPYDGYDINVGPILNSPVRVNVRNEMYYKDE